MNKIIDYLQWRGDLSFSKDPLNDVDALILSLLSYLPLKEVVPGFHSKEKISLKKAALQYFSKTAQGKNRPLNFNPTSSPSFDSGLDVLLEQAADCPRFESIQLSKYDENMDFVIGQQFAAVTFSLNTLRHEKVIAFRGTDNSLIGWKENFALLYMEQTPAQESALRYLERSIGFLSGPCTVCGHSKGGNLAVYASAHLNPARQNRISKVINFDGPGFNFSVVNREPFLNCESKVQNYLPEESIIGIILDPVGKRNIVSSSSQSIYQHNALNWHVEQSHFSEGKLSGTSKTLEQSLKTWLNQFSLSDRETFSEALFDILGASEGVSIKFDPIENMQELKNILIKYSNLDAQTKDLLTQVFVSFTNQTTRSLTTRIMEKLPGIN